MFNLIPWKARNRGQVPVRRGDASLDYPLAELRDEFDALMNRFFGERLGNLMSWPSLGGWDRSAWDWNMNLEDRGHEYALEAELPGFEPEDLNVKVTGNSLVVRAEHKSENAGKRGTRFHQNRFYQCLPLPHGVDPDQIDARYHRGVLEVHLPKSEATDAKRIEVKAD